MPSKGTVVVGYGNNKRLIGLATLPELLHVLLQLGQRLMGKVTPIVGLVTAAGWHVAPLPVMRLRVL